MSQSRKLPSGSRVSLAAYEKQDCIEEMSYLLQYRPQQTDLAAIRTHVVQMRTHNKIISLYDQVLAKANKLRDSLKKQEPVRKCLSYASRCGDSGQGVKTIAPLKAVEVTVPKILQNWVNKPILTTRSAFILNDQFRRQAQRERRQFFSLAVAIAKRQKTKTQAFRVIRLTDFERNLLKRRIQLTSKQHLQKSVVSDVWPESTSAEVTSVKISGWGGRKVMHPKSTPNIFNESTKQVKQRLRNNVLSAATNLVDNHTRRYLPEFSKHQRREELIALMGRTSLGSNLLMSLLTYRLAKEDKVHELESIARSLRVEAQMDDEGSVGLVPTDSEVKGNVIVTNVAPVEKGIPPPVVEGFKDMAVDSETQTYKQMTDRWIFVRSVPWSTNQNVNSEITSMELPRDILAYQGNSPNLQIIYLHRYFRFKSMIIRIILTSNAFQTGALMGYWTYLPKNSLRGRLYSSIYSGSQRNNVILAAGTSNEAQLVIPYEFWNSMMTINDCKMGWFSLSVLNNLAVTATVAPTANVGIYFAFEGLEAYGMISRSLGSVMSQMDTVASIANLGTAVLNTVSRDRNRDLPPLPVQPQYLIPQATGSMCYTDHAVEPLNVLRADPAGQRPLVDVSDSMDPLKVARTWGLWKQFRINKNQPSGTQVFYCRGVPLQNSEEYVASFESQGIMARYYTPLAAIASLYGKWRGGIEFMIRCYCSHFHNLELMLGVVPLISEKSAKELDMSTLKFSAHQIVNIRDSTEIVFRVPWYWNNAWATTRSFMNGEDYDIPSHFFVYVVNPLISIDSVVDFVTCNLYVRAAQDFEVSVPRWPTIMPALVSVSAVPPHEYLDQVDTGFIRLYTSYNTDIPMTTSGKYAITMFKAAAAEEFCQFKAKLGEYYRVKKKTSSGVEWRMNYYKGGKVYYVDWFVYDPELNNNGVGLVVCETQANAKALATEYRTSKSADSRKIARTKYAVQYEKDGDWSQVRNPGQIIWQQAVNDRTSILIMQVFSLGLNVEAQGDEGSSMPVWQLDQIATSTSCGLRTYGERFPDLKSISRRWNHCLSLNTRTCKTASARDCKYVARWPVSPTRYLMNGISSSFDNRAREGAKTLISTMYGYWEGGIRYRGVITGQVPVGCSVYVEHRFDETSNTHVADDSTFVPTTNQVLTLRDMMMGQYASFMQNLSVNPVWTVEVPYYSNCERLTTMYGDTPGFNGFVYLWVHSSVEVDFTMEIFYAVADDYKLSVFQGLPACYDLADFVPEPERGSIEKQEEQVEPQMDEKGEPIPSTSTAPPSFFTIPTTVHNTMQQVSQAATAVNKSTENLSQPAQVLLTNASQAAQNITETSSIFAKVGQKLSALADYFTSSLATLKDKTVSSAKSIWDGITKFGFSILSHLIYCVLNPTPGTISWAVINILVVVFDLSWNTLATISTKISSIWNRLWRRDTTPTPQSEDPDISTYAATLFTLFCGICGLKVKGFVDLSSVSKGLFAFSMLARNSSYVGRFFKDNVVLFKRIWEKIVGLFGKTTNHMQILQDAEDERLKTWLMETAGILHPSVRDKLTLDQVWANKVFELSVVGRALTHSLLHESVTTNIPRIVKAVQDRMKELQILESELIDLKIFSAARYEPWCLWASGPAGSGKTRLLEEIARRMAIEMHITHPHPYYPLTAGQKYFDAFCNQPTIMIDDFLSLSINASPELYHQFLQMKSCALLNPPFANVEEKRKLINFSNLFVSSNLQYFDNIPGMHDYRAYNRRRDCLIDLRLKPSVNLNEPLASQFTVEQLEALEHVDIYHCLDVFERTISLEHLIERVPGESYMDTVWKTIRHEAQKYHEIEVNSYKKRCKFAIDTMSQVSGTDSLDGYLEAVKTALKSVNKDKDGNLVPVDLEHVTANWKKVCVESATHVIGQFEQLTNDVTNDPSVSPQGSEGEEIPGVDPFGFEVTSGEDVMPDDFGHYAIGATIEPEARYKLSGYGSMGYHTQGCHHKRVDSDNLQYSTHFVFSERRFGRELKTLPRSVRLGNCMVKISATRYAPLDNCVYQRIPFLRHLYEEEKRQDPEFYSTFVKAIADGTYEHSTYSSNYPPEFKDFVVQETQFRAQHIQGLAVSPIERRVQEEIKRVNRMYSRVGEQFVPAEPPRGFVRKAWDALVYLFKLVRTILVHLLLVLAGFVTVLTLLSIFKELWNYEVPLPNMTASGDYVQARTKSPREKALSLLRAEPNGSDEESVTILTTKNLNHDQIVKKIKKNMFLFVGVHKSELGERVGIRARCLGLYGRKFLVLKHYIELYEAKGIEELHILGRDGNLNVKIPIKDIRFEWTDAGYGVGEFPKYFPMLFPKVTQYIPSEDFNGWYPSKMQMLEFDLETSRIYELQTWKLDRTIKVPATSTQTAWEFSQGFEYNWGGKGRCGSLLLAPQLASPLVGVHTAGIGTSTGYAQLLLRETFEAKNTIAVDYVEPQIEDKEEHLYLEGDYNYVGSVDKEMKVITSDKSKIVPSMVHGVFPVTTEPAPLSRRDPRLNEPIDPLRLGCEKRCVITPSFDREDSLLAFKHLSSLINYHVKPMRVEVGKLPIATAIEGIPLPGYESIEFHSSEGFPWVKMRPSNAVDKSWMFKLEFKSEENRYRLLGIHRDLMEVLVEKTNLRQKGVVPVTFYAACLKDARISKDKVPIPGKTRVFEMSPVELTIAQRQLNLDFTVAYMNARLKAENTIGINCEGAEWTSLANYLNDFSPYILSADYSGFGPGVKMEILAYAQQVGIEWYEKYGQNEQERLEREILSEEVRSSPIIMKSLVFQPTCGLASGNCETVTLNSRVNSLYIRVAYLGLARQNAPQFCDMYWFEKLVRMVSNGDDLLISVKATIVKWFNNVTLRNFFSEYGIKMTPPSKSDNLSELAVEYEYINQVKYLKRGFKPHPTRKHEWLAPLEENSVTDTANWVIKSTDWQSASILNSEMACRSAYSNGPKFYYEICGKLQRAWLDHGFRFVYPTWTSLDMHVWEGTDGPLFYHEKNKK